MKIHNTPFELLSANFLSNHYKPCLFLSMSLFFLSNQNKSSLLEHMDEPYIILGSFLIT